jgi:hypothetical protein
MPLFLSQGSWSDMFLMISFWWTKDDVLFEFLHLLFSSLRNTDSYSLLHSQEPVCRFFEMLCKLVFVVFDRLV